MTSTQKILNVIKQYDRFLVATHVNPDPDAISSQLAMGLFLRSLGKKVFLLAEEDLPERFKFLPESYLIKKNEKGSQLNFEAVVVVDCGELSRIGDVQKLITKSTPVVNIDHHITNESFGDFNLVVPDASSTAEVIFDLLKTAKFKVTKDIAVLLYLGIMTDTGSFRFENTTSKTHAIVSELAKFNFSVSKLYNTIYETVSLHDLKLFTGLINKFETLERARLIFVDLPQKVLKDFSKDFDLRDKIFSFLKTIKGVEVIAIFTEKDSSQTQINFRSQGIVDVASLAHQFGGGGHKRASGCTLNFDMLKAKKIIHGAIKKVMP